MGPAGLATLEGEPVWKGSTALLEFELKTGLKTDPLPKNTKAENKCQVGRWHTASRLRSRRHDLSQLQWPKTTLQSLFFLTNVQPISATPIIISYQPVLDLKAFIMNLKHHNYPIPVNYKDVYQTVNCIVSKTCFIISNF